MAAIAGKGGKVMSGANTLAFIESWEIGISDEALESTGLGAASRTYIGRGLPEGNVSITWRALDNSDTGTGEFRTAALTNSTTITGKFYESASKYWSGTMVVTNFSQSTNVDGLVTGSASGVISGGLTYN